MPSAFLASLSVPDLTASWRKRIADGEWQTLVCDEAGSVVGWISFGAVRNGDASLGAGEIKALNVEPTAWGRGCGRLLCAEACHRLARAGVSDVMLWVLRDNDRAIRFYESLGFIRDLSSGEFFEVAGVALPEVCYRKKLQPSAS